MAAPFRIGIVGDTHFGFAWGTERAEDSFEQARRALLAAIAQRPDLIILTGDVFDSSVPRQEVLAKAAEMLRLAAAEPASGISVQGKTLPFGIPIVAIHGTHERRPKGLANPLQVLDKAGVLLYLQAETIVFEKGGEQLAVTGFGGVPEEYALDVLKRFAPQPVPGATNILVFHQSVRPFVFCPESEGLELADLPAGFDTYIDGHLHWPFLERHPSGGDVIFSGSTIVTQVRRNEAGKDKCVWLAGEGIPRQVFFPAYRKNLLVESAGLAELEASLAAIPSEDPRPLVRVKFAGTDDLTSIIAKYSGRFMLSVERAGAQEQPAIPAASQEERALTVERRAFGTLAKVLGPAAPANLESLYSLLLAGKQEDAKEALLSDD